MTLSSDGRAEVEGFITCSVRTGDVGTGTFDSRICAACAAWEGSVTLALSGGAVDALSWLFDCAASLRRFRRLALAVDWEVAPRPDIDIAADSEPCRHHSAGISLSAMVFCSYLRFWVRSWRIWLLILVIDRHPLKASFQCAYCHV